MAARSRVDQGKPFEARIQRLFMCQGAYAERDLLVRTVRGSSRLATDVDVVAHDYNINFHHRRIYAECKGAQKPSTLNRVIWVRGLMNVIGAEFGYLIVDHCDPDSVAFARSHRVHVLQKNGLEALETALGIGDQFWPGRANLAMYMPLEHCVEELTRERDPDGFTQWLCEARQVWREASALAFSYSGLNAILRILAESRDLARSPELASERRTALRYALAALLVRLSQYVLFAAADTLGMTTTERESYIAERMIAGEMGVERSRRVLGSALKLAEAKLAEEGISGPVNWDVDRLLVAPTYCKPFAEVTGRVIADGHRARILPLAMELRLFGFGGDEGKSGGLVKRARFGLELTGLIRGFAVQSFDLPEEMLDGPGHAGGLHAANAL